MLGSLSRLPLSLDPLIAEAKRRARQRRTLIALAVLLLAGLAAGVTFAFRSPSGGSPNGGGLASASYSQWGISLRYPAAWTRLDCTNWISPSGLPPIFLLTSARPAPTCAHTPSVFPPAETLGPDGAVFFLASGTGFGEFKWNTTIDGRPAEISPRLFTSKYLGANDLRTIGCPAGVRREYRAAYIRRPGGANDFVVGALVCGPHFTTGDVAVRKVLASLRFARPTS